MTVANHSSSNAKAALRSDFTAVGLKPADAFRVLPSWWTDAIAHPSGVFEVKGFAAKHFGLEIGPDGALRRRPMPHACFKTRRGTDISEIASARAMATAVAKVVASVTTTPWTGSFPSAATLRAQAVVRGAKPWVGLDDLLAACWSHGVPVIYMPALPVARQKMDGMVVFCAGRPAILVTRKAAAPAWMLFVLAHEMGHVGLGHFEPCEGGAIVDETVSEDDGDPDDQEKAANAYALELLTGGERTTIRLDRLMKAEGLAQAALRFGYERGIDPGHVILNAVRNTRRNGRELWPLGNSALRHIGEDVATAEMCREALRRNVTLPALADDSFEFLERVGLL